MTFAPASSIALGDAKYILRAAPVDETGGLAKYYVLPDWETQRWGHNVRPVAPAPAVFPLSSTPDGWPDSTYCPLNERWQYFWVDLLAMAKYGKILASLSKTQAGYILKAFKGLTGSKAFITNYKGTDKYRNYPGRENTTMPDPQMESLMCCGNYVYSDAALVKNSKGKMMVNVMTFKYYETPPVVTADTLKDPRVHIARTVRTNKTLGNFPHLGGVPVPFPLLTRGPAWYPLAEMK